jgi:hypothetical protein
MFDREDTINYIWDVYKSIYGIRPRHIKFSEMDNEQLQQLAEILANELKINMEETDRETAEAERKFEAMIQDITECGGIGGSPINRSTALRWIADDRRSAQDIEQLLWEHDLIYSNKFEAYVKEFLEAIHG